MSRFLPILRRLSTACLVGVLFVSLSTFASAAAFEDVIRVGLFYGSNALPSANLQNSVGSGYEFGYFDGNGDFVSLGATDLEKITVCKDENLYLSGGTFYETPTASSYTLIGAFHLQAPGTYDSYDQALTAAAGYPHGFPAYVDGKYVVRFEYFSTSANASAELASYPAATVVGQSSSCYTVVSTETGGILFEYDQGTGNYFGIMPVGDDSTQTWFKGYKYHGGFQYERRYGMDVSVINYVHVDDYIEGVLPYEFVGSGPLESLKAGAVAIRTFAMASSKHQALGIDVCNSTCCQVYSGVYSGAYVDNVQKAAQETHGICAYYNGKLIEAVYFAADGGATEDAKNTWGSDVPYLQGKLDPYEDAISFGSQSWEYFVTAEDLTTMLQKRGNNNSTIVSLEVTKRTAMGNVQELTFTDSRGEEYSYSNDNSRVLSSVPGITYMSRNFEIVPTGANQDSAIAPSQFEVYDGNSTVFTDSVTVLTANGTTTASVPSTVITNHGNVTVGGSTTTDVDDNGWLIVGRGYGHNVGLSQWGAYAMAQQGFTYDEILKFYYTGITVE